MPAEPVAHLIDGELLGIDGDVLRIRSRDNVADIALPTSSVARVWVMDGRRGSFWKGAGIGLIVGVVAGTAIGATQEFCALTCGSAAGMDSSSGRRRAFSSEA